MAGEYSASQMMLALANATSMQCYAEGKTTEDCASTTFESSVLSAPKTVSNLDIAVRNEM